MKKTQKDNYETQDRNEKNHILTPTRTVPGYVDSRENKSNSIKLGNMSRIGRPPKKREPERVKIVNSSIPSLADIYVPLDQSAPSFQQQLKKQEREKNQEIVKFRKKLMRINDESSKIRKKKVSLVEKEKLLKHKRVKLLSKIKSKGFKMGHFRDLVESVLIENVETKEANIECDLKERKAIENLAELLNIDTNSNL